MPGIDGVDAFFMCFLFQFLDESLCDTVHTAYGGNDPHLITHTNVAVLTHIALKGSALFLDAKFFVDRVICVFERT